MSKIIQYLKNVYSEMLKVSWPNRNEIVSATTLVVIFSIVFGVIVKLFDFVLAKAMGLLLNM